LPQNMDYIFDFVFLKQAEGRDSGGTGCQA
jgi:hypothetical protein